MSCIIYRCTNQDKDKLRCFNICFVCIRVRVKEWGRSPAAVSVAAVDVFNVSL